MDVLLQSPDVLQALVNSYMNPPQLQVLQEAYSTHNLGIINTEYIRFDNLTRGQLTLYNPKFLREVEITNLDDPMALTELYNFNLKRLSIDNLTQAVDKLDDASKEELIAVFTHLALTLEELELHDEPDFYFNESPTDLLDTVTFPRLRSLYIERMYSIDAPGLTSLHCTATTVDITELTYPNLTEFSANECTIDNVIALTQFPLTILELSSAELDEDLSIIGLTLTTLTLGNVSIPDVLKFPRSLEHLTIFAETFDVSRIRRLKLKTLKLDMKIPTRLTKIRLSALESVDLTGFVLDDAFFLDAPMLNTLALQRCTVNYTSFIDAPRLTKAAVITSECTDFLPDSIVELTLSFAKGPVVRSVKALTNLKSLEVSNTQFKLKWIRHLKLNQLTVSKCDVSTLKYLRGMDTLRELSLKDNPMITDDSLKDLKDLHLAILNLYNTGVKGPGLKYLPSTLQKLILPSIDREYLDQLHLPRLQQLLVAVPSENPRYAHLVNGLARE